MKKITPLLSAAAVAGLALFTTSCAVDTYSDGYSSVSVSGPGHVIRTLPHGYTTVRYDNMDYYVHRNTYYRPYRGGYVVVDPPRRTSVTYTERSIRRLPHGYRHIRHNGLDYYHHNDVYYRPHGRGYIRVDRPFTTRTVYRPGYVARTLPVGYRTVRHRGMDYYYHNNVYYRPHQSGFVVVSAPI